MLDPATGRRSIRDANRPIHSSFTFRPPSRRERRPRSGVVNTMLISRTDGETEELLDAGTATERDVVMSVRDVVKTYPNGTQALRGVGDSP